MILNNIPSLVYFIPEITICLGIILLLIISVFNNVHQKTFIISILTSFIAFIPILITFNYYNLLFLGNIVIDPYSNFFKILFLFTVIIVIILTYYDKDVDRSDWPEYFSLLLIVTLGMFLMSSSVNLLMVYLAIELVSIPSYILAGFNHNDKHSNEASLKYVLYGSFASGLMLFGMSWIYGQTGSLYFSDIKGMLMFSGNQGSISAIIAFLLLFAGFGYKISAAPFHYWVPDVYQGAPTPITAFFSVAPKIAGISLLIRFLYFVLAQGAMYSIYVDWNLILAVLSAFTMSIGNLLAIRQSNVKRILAYSSISHVGFMMITFAVVSPTSIIHILFYITMYMFMTLGAFSVLIYFYNTYNFNTVDDWNGIGYIHPFICSFMIINLLALAGLPPTSGFIAKFYILATIIESKTYYWLAIVAIINTVISLYYYFNLARSMFLEKESKVKCKKPDIFITVIIIFTSIQGVLFYIYWSELYELIRGLIS